MARTNSPGEEDNSDRDEAFRRQAPSEEAQRIARQNSWGGNSKASEAALASELRRLDAKDVDVLLTDEFEPDAGVLARIGVGDAYWHLLPGELLDLLQQLPAGAGAEAIKQLIEEKATTVWHGPSPPGSRAPE